MTTLDIDRIRFVTRYFNELQGLRKMVPLGLAQMLVGASDLFPRLAILLLLVPLGVVVLSLRTDPYYRRTFGVVEQPPAGLPSIYSPAGPAPLAISRQPAKRTMLTLTLMGCLLFLILRAIAALTTESYGGHLVAFGQGMYISYGFGLVGIWLRRERRLSQSYYLVFGALLLGLAVLGASLALVPPALWHIPHILYACLVSLTCLEMALMLCGGTFFICGLLDHLQIVRVLRPAQEEPA
jgi:hypothetical protein